MPGNARLTPGIWISVCLMNITMDPIVTITRLPVSLFYALHEGLAVINEEGIKNRWKRHHEAHLRLIKGLEALGLTMLVPEPHRLWNLNTPKVPRGCG